MKYFYDFQGRIDRAEFWALAIVSIALWAVAFLFALIQIAIISSIFSFVLVVAGLVVFLGAAARRLHDRDKSGWYLLFFIGVPSLLQTFFSSSGETTIVIFSGGIGGSRIDLICLAISVWMFVELGGFPGTSGPNKYGSGAVSEAAEARTD